MAGESPGLPVLCVVRKAGSSLGSWGCIAAFTAQRFLSVGLNGLWVQLCMDPRGHEEFIWEDGRSKHLDRKMSSYEGELCMHPCCTSPLPGDAVEEMLELHGLVGS